MSSVCRGGFFTHQTTEQRDESRRRNRQAVELANLLNADSLVLVCGAPHGLPLPEARRQVLNGIEDLVSEASQLNVRLAIEPLHPMMVEERSVVVTLAEALALAERFDPSEVGVIVDAYHVFWDPLLAESLSQGRGRILGFHVSDWESPPPNFTAGRAVMGEGSIDLRGMHKLVTAAGYEGWIEVEVIRSAHQSVDQLALLKRLRDAFIGSLG